MSFGWSAGDIATALAVTYNLIQALDDAYGAANNYREAVAFLDDLKRVLEPLQAFTAWSAYPTYGGEIKKQLEQIRGPVQEFLTAVLKYEPSLGEKARKGWKRSLRTTFLKLDWYIFMEKKVLSLRGKTESHMRILDTLMQRLTLDIVWKTQQELPNTLRSTLEEMIQPGLIDALRECLPEISLSTSQTNYEAVVAKLSEHHQLIYSRLEDIKQGLERSQTIQQQIQDGILGGTGFCEQKALSGVLESTDLRQVTHAESYKETPGHHEVTSAVGTDEDSLSKVCYLILLYFLQFLKGVFLALSRMVEPSRALISTPLAKYNITFLDAIGRPPRVLPYEYFRSFKILQAFIEQEFKDLPGSSWVTRGRYLISSLRNNRTLNDKNWNRIVAPGAKIAMSMLVRKRLESPSSPDEGQCPEFDCPGTWARPKTLSWTTCPVCQKEIFTSVLEASERAEDGEIKNQRNVRSSDPQFRRKKEAPLDKEPQEIESDPESDSDSESELEEEDISSFRRIARVVLGLSNRVRRVIRRHGDSPYEQLDFRYKEVPLKHHKQFWRVGRVFMMLWSDPAAPCMPLGEPRNGSYFSTIWLAEGVYTEVRHFVVIQGGYRSSFCSPIQTYRGRATLKPNLEYRQQHAIIYTSENVPQRHSYQSTNGTITQENLSKDPIRVRREQDVSEGKLDPTARIDYSKVYAVESNVRVLNIGMVDKDSLPSLKRNSLLFRPTEPNEASSHSPRRKGRQKRLKK